ncbi:MAG TPA: hypothetical protein VJ727_01175 [Rhodanobacteraceae bacterium]|nr:hypothetical protein [Rhodanobacteraceae bacterium]
MLILLCRTEAKWIPACAGMTQSDLARISAHSANLENWRYRRPDHRAHKQVQAGMESVVAQIAA